MVKTILYVLIGILILGIINSIYVMIHANHIVKKIKKLFYYFDLQLLSLSKIGDDYMTIGRLNNLKLDETSETGTIGDESLNICLAGYYEDSSESKLMMLKKLYLINNDKLKDLYMKHGTINREILDSNSTVYIIKQDDGTLDLGCDDVLISDLSIPRLQYKTLKVMSGVISHLYDAVSLKKDYIGCYIVDYKEIFELMKSMEEMIHKTLLSKEEAADE